MNLHRRTLLLLPALLLTLVNGSAYATSRLIVTMDSSARQTATATGLQISGTLDAARMQSLSTVAGVNLQYAKTLWQDNHIVNLPANQTEQQIAETVSKLKNAPGVLAVTPDRMLKKTAAPNDTYYGTKPPQLSGFSAAWDGQWWLKTPVATDTKNQSNVIIAHANNGAINAQAAWDAGFQGSNNVVVAVVDTGIRRLTNELSPRLLAGYDFVSANPFGDDPDFSKDGNGWDSDPTDPGDRVTTTELNNTNMPYKDIGCPTTNDWHGTFIAGEIGAVANNNTGVTGLDWNARILPVRALGKCGIGSLSDILVAMRWAAGLPVAGVPTNPNPAKVINLSLGSGTCSAAEQSTVNEIVAAGVTIVVAAGNNASSPSAPSDCKGVIAAGGNARDGSKLRYSSYGTYTTLMAPGGSDNNPLYSTINSGSVAPDETDADYYGAEIGTSFSAPLVAGAVSLMYGRDINLRPKQIKAILEQSARAFPISYPDIANTCTAPPTDPGTDGDTSVSTGYCICTKALCGAGILDVAAALTAVTANKPPVVEPITTISTTTAQSVAFTVTASDAENDVVTLSADNLPTGASFNSTNGQFSWTNPTAGTYFVAFYAADRGQEARSKEVAIIRVTQATTPAPTPVPTPTPSPTTTTTTTTTTSGGGGGAIGWMDGLLLLGLLAAAGFVKMLIDIYSNQS